MSEPEGPPAGASQEGAAAAGAAAPVSGRESVTTPVPTPPQETLPWIDRLRAALAEKLAARGLGAPGLAACALAPAAIAGICIAIDHFGLGAALGLLALAAAWLATAPGPVQADGSRKPPGAFVRVLAHAQAPLLLGGCALSAAGDGAPARTAVAVWALGVLLLLPLARSLARPGALASGPIVWSFAERMSALLAGLLLGHPSLAPFLVALVATADLLVRLACLLPRAAGQPSLPPALQAFFAPDARPQAGVRLASRLVLAVVILLYVLLARSESWRF